MVLIERKNQTFQHLMLMNLSLKPQIRSCTTSIDIPISHSLRRGDNSKT